MEVRFRKIQSVVTETLTLFEQYDIHATWAVVGLLNHQSFHDLLEKNQAKSISYQDKNFSPFPFSDREYARIPFEILTAVTEINQILSTPNQELASHTYAHYYTLEAGQREQDFKKDIESMSLVGASLNHRFQSIVFPRNQVNKTYLHLLSQSGYRAFRGNQPNKDWDNVRYGAETKMQKIRRVTDAYFRISKTKSFRLHELPVENGLVNIPASRFLRPNRGSTFLERRKLKRVKSEMTAAARQGTIYHLWWHPHNFTYEPEKSLVQLEEILKHFKALQKSHAFVSMNMSEISAYAGK